MHLSLWTQFSSNHSANFMVVGEFESVEWAETVADELRDMLREISAWWVQYSTYDEIEAVQKQLREQQNGLTPPEAHYKDQYQLEKWGVGVGGVLDWVQSPNAAHAVRTFNHLVIIGIEGIEGIGDTWAGARPFDAILQKLGAKITVDGEGSPTYCGMNLTCTAPSVEVVQAIYAQITYPHGTVCLAKHLRPTRGKIVIAERQIKLEKYQMQDDYYVPNQRGILFEEELARILAYLSGQGCTDIVYEFSEVPY